MDVVGGGWDDLAGGGETGGVGAGEPAVQATVANTIAHARAARISAVISHPARAIIGPFPGRVGAGRPVSDGTVTRRSARLRSP
ncbi:MAG: hypothetical protein ACXVWF_07730 [Actinomycetota bacterium]